MTLDDYKAQQELRLKELKRLARTDEKRAREEARERLLAAKIIDTSGALASHYR